MDFETLAAGLNCTPPAIDDFPRDFLTEKQRQDGGIIVHILVSLYLFVALAVVCDKFFVPAVEKICHALNMSSDVAGATFMAAATSAPELFVNVIGTFITEGDIGVGTIVGSAVFNILAVAACCGIGAGMCGVKVVPLDWWPLTRDCLAYGITVSILICIIHDERVEWYEALTLVLLYTVYILIMYFDKSIQKCARGGIKQAQKHSRKSSKSSTKAGIETIEATNMSLALEIVKEKGNSNANPHNQSNSNRAPVEPPAHIIPPTHLNGSIKAPQTETLEVDDQAKLENCPVQIEKGEPTSLWTWPAGRGKFTQISKKRKDIFSSTFYGVLTILSTFLLFFSLMATMIGCDTFKTVVPWAFQKYKTLCNYLVFYTSYVRIYDLLSLKKDGCWEVMTWILTWPIHLVFWFTIPDCEKPRFKKWFPLTFIMCIIWIGSLSYVVAWMITIIGDTLKIPDSVMGITFLAAGTSVPEAVSSVIVAKQGHGSMGISNSIGSNTFDILLCLGLPWFIKATFMPTLPGKYWVGINSAGIEYSAISLLSSLLLLYIAFALNKFKLDKRVGWVCLLMYAVFLILASLIELNAFFRVNLPTCGR